MDLATRLTVVRQAGRGEDDAEEPTDKWTAEASTAGQRAIHLAKHHKGWAIVPPTGLQRSAAVANKHLKQNIAVRAAPFPPSPFPCLHAHGGIFANICQV